MSRLSVHVVYEHAGDMVPFGSSFIRHLRPLSHPQVAEHLHLSFSHRPQQADVIVFERALSPLPDPFAAERWLDEAAHLGARVVYSLDDDLLAAGVLPPPRQAIVRLMCREARGVLVTTPPLAEKVGKLARRVRVLPNALDERLFFGDDSRPERRSAQVVVGYMGTWTHAEDLSLVIGPLRAVLRRHVGAVRCEVVGGDPGFTRYFDGLPVSRVAVPPNCIRYPSFVGWMRSRLQWDIALAPLADTPLNRCKSDLKYLDYAGLGAAGVYSDTDAYRHTVQPRLTGLLASDSWEAWEGALEELVARPDWRRALASNARDEVRRKRTVGATATEFLEAMHALAG